jgi:hypothetical protein
MPSLLTGIARQYNSPLREVLYSPVILILHIRIAVSRDDYLINSGLTSKIFPDLFDGTILAAHGTDIILSRGVLFPVPSRLFRVNRQFHLRIPVQILPCPRHLSVSLNGQFVPSGDIRRMGGDLGDNDTFSHIIHIRQREVLGRGHITQKVRTSRPGKGPSDGACHMVIASRNICNQGT